MKPVRRIVIRSAFKRIIIPPSPGESEVKTLTYRWKVYCRECMQQSHRYPGELEIVTWAQTWEHAMLNAQHHIRMHAWTKDVAEQVVLGDFEDTNLFRG